MGNHWRTEVKDGVLIVGDAPGGNYRSEVIRHGSALQGSGVHIAHVAHDDWCGIWSGRECDCDPDVTTEKLPEPPAHGE